MFEQLIQVLSWLMWPVLAIAVVDDWFLRPRRRIAALPAAAVDPPWLKAVYGALPIVLIAGAKDEGHPAGTHEYEATVETIRKSLEESNVADQVQVEVVLNGWPENPKTLDDAATIVLVSSGADRKETNHPFLVGDRMKVLEKQMDRGCGLVMLHWSVFVPIKHEKQFSRWIGGFFDYERGDDPKGWHSAITFANAKILPKADHPIGRGVTAFDHRDEYYYRIRFPKDDKRITPIVTVTLPEVEEPQVVAWAVERKDGGRGFAFTGGHFQKSWEENPYRTMMLNAVCWTAKVPVPKSGVHKELSFDDQWTPKPHLSKGDLPKEVEADWVDGRIRKSDVGPFYMASIAMPDPADLNEIWQAAGGQPSAQDAQRLPVQVFRKVDDRRADLVVNPVGFAISRMPQRVEQERQAALLERMKLLRDEGLRQARIPLQHEDYRRWSHPAGAARRLSRSRGRGPPAGS